MKFDFDKLFYLLQEEYSRSKAPSVTLIANNTKDPYKILISTIISLRTKDQVTINASNRIFYKASNIYELEKLSVKEIEELIYPAGFYRIKAKRIKDIAKKIIKDYNGKIPDTIEELIKLPGVGRKTANLVVSLGYNKPGVCVDTHVHRITNRLGLVKTKRAEETEIKLREILPEKYWIEINTFMVSFGQTICKPISPFCSKCSISVLCKKVGVVKNR